LICTLGWWFAGVCNLGWETRLVLDALTMAIWRRKPKNSPIIYSDQGSQFGSDEFARWCKDNRSSPSMSRRGNCWDNAVTESFFSSLKSELIKKKIYQSSSVAKSEFFEYVEELYDCRKSPWDNRVRRHSYLEGMSPETFEEIWRKQA
jgi:putative transposase